ncbi:corrinoid protein [Zhaonella formicivorans]|uniref:corrinoid protein n=1 Tax=Zhaonella formicivorans TaxID=2528593 RepID=UPI0010CFC1D7|nr:corrinoid protein [Zhaonella formicivorans]
MRRFERIANALVKGKAAKVIELVEEALKKDVPPIEILNRGLLAGMNNISERYRNEEVFIPDVLLASRAFHAGMRVVRPALLQDVRPTPGHVVIGTVAGDLHDIGKNLVVTFLRSAGYEVTDLGIDVHPEEFVEAVVKNNAQVLGMSALLTTTMPVMDSTIKLLEQSGLRERVKVIVGGGPITREYGKKINADGYASEARSAVALVERCLQELTEENGTFVESA